MVEIALKSIVAENR